MPQASGGFSPQGAEQVSGSGRPRPAVWWLAPVWLAPVWLAPVCLALVCLAWIAFVWAWEPAYLTLAADDAFYYLQIARNVGVGNGSTFDGLHATNGYHPLWLGVCSLLARVFPLEPPNLMRLALSAQIGLVVLGVLLLGRALPAYRSAITTAATVLLLHFYFAKVLINGMESALLFALMAATLLLWRRPTLQPKPPSRAWAASLGLLSGLAVLARLEALAFALPIALLPLAFDPGPTSPAKGVRLRLTVASSFSLPLAGYLLANKLSMGHWLPVSGAIKVEKGLRFFTSARILPIGMLLLATVVGGWLLWRLFDSESRAVLKLASPVAAFAVAALCVQLLVIGNRPPIWYLVPWALLLLLLASVAVDKLRAGRKRALALAALFAWLLWSTAAWNARLDPSSYSPYLAARRSGEWLRSQTSEDSVAAGWACGIAAAHSNRTFVNLDGLANSWHYKDDFLDQGRTAAYVNEVLAADYVVQYFQLETLPYVIRYGYRGVSLNGWYIARSECVEFHSIVRRSRPRRLVYTVLQRQPGENLPRFTELESFTDKLCPPAD